MAAIPPIVHGVLLLGIYVSFCSAGIIYYHLLSFIAVEMLNYILHEHESL